MVEDVGGLIRRTRWPVAGLVRLGRVLLGLLLSSWAFLWIVHAHLGTGPWHVVQQGLSAHFGIALGSAVWVTGAIFFVLALATGERPGFATLASVLLGGLYINALAPTVHDVHGLLARSMAMVGGTLLMTFGGALYMSAALGASPLDSLMTGIFRRTPWSLRAVRLGLEVVGLVIGWLLGGEVGVGSVFIGLTVGPLIQLWLRVLRAMPEKRSDVLAGLHAEPDVV